MADAQILKLFEEGSYEIVPHDNVRKIIARRLVEAKTTIPHFYLTVDTEIDALLALRADINAAAPIDKDKNPAWKVSVNDMVIKALAMALQRVPDANVTWTEGGMLRHKHSDIGVAVSIPGGLITPVVRHAEEKRLSDISNEMKDLALAGAVRKLAPHEYQGGSSAVSNLGMFGVKDFAAVINPPHATILAVGRGRGEADRAQGQDRGGDDHDRDALDRPPRRRRRARRAAHRGVQGADRESRPGCWRRIVYPDIRPARQGPGRMSESEGPLRSYRF